MEGVVIRETFKPTTSHCPPVRMAVLTRARTHARGKIANFGQDVEEHTVVIILEYVQILNHVLYTWNYKNVLDLLSLNFKKGPINGPLTGSTTEWDEAGRVV